MCYISRAGEGEGQSAAGEAACDSVLLECVPKAQHSRAEQRSLALPCFSSPDSIDSFDKKLWPRKRKENEENYTRCDTKNMRNTRCEQGVPQCVCVLVCVCVRVCVLLLYFIEIDILGCECICASILLLLYLVASSQSLPHSLFLSLLSRPLALCVSCCVLHSFGILFVCL